MENLCPYTSDSSIDIFIAPTLTINETHEYKDWIESFLCVYSWTHDHEEIQVPLLWLGIKDREGRTLRNVIAHPCPRVKTSHLLGLMLSTSHRVETWDGPCRRWCCCHSLSSFFCIHCVSFGINFVGCRETKKELSFLSLPLFLSFCLSVCQSPFFLFLSFPHSLLSTRACLSVWLSVCLSLSLPPFLSSSNALGHD
jgi:hypothetical protein